MNQLVWTLPVPSTALLEFTNLTVVSPQICVIDCEYEGDDAIVSLKLIFDEVESYRVTFHEACNSEMINLSYDVVADVGSSDWLSLVALSIKGHGGNAQGIRHLMIYFDEGPGYEFICRAFRVEETTRDFPLV